jgi:UDP-N-acetylglucosamine--N-acetylmuramyl-(pentapeptide) pyrophosphoryl-undecaprenol N-acetylglucosamine transferase
LAGYHVLKYADRMDLVLAVADLAVSRAGTSTVAELTALGIPAVFVPYASGNGEQRLNAREAVAAGGAILVPDADFTPEWVDRALIPLLTSRARIADMAARMSTVGALDGTDRMVALIDEARARGAARHDG